MLQPKRVKFRKVSKGRRKGTAHSGNVVTFGDFGLQAEESVWVTARQIEAARRAITH
jgi:large subunit ribosomal protein L16